MRIAISSEAFRVNRMLVLIVTACVSTGIVALASASYPRSMSLFGDPHFLLKRQLIWIGLGLMAASASRRIDYHVWERWAVPIALLNAALLILVLVVGKEIGGGRRWIRIGIINFQPSEFAKFVSIVMTSAWMCSVPLRTGRLKEGILVPGVGLGFLMLMILFEPDVGTAFLIGATGALLLFVGGARIDVLGGSALFSIAVLFIYVRLDPLRWRRILAWIWPERYPDIAYQYLQAKKAFIMGGTHVDLGSSLQKHFYLPEVHTDFILPIVGEELGLLGSLAVLMLFTGFLSCGIIIALNARDAFGRMMAFGITAMIMLQAIINMSVVTGLLPTKGISLPFFSYGGSGLLVALFEVGVLLNIGRQHGNTAHGRWARTEHHGWWKNRQNLET